jgi:hypothetical protein
MVCVTPSATPEHTSGWLDLSSIPMFLRCFLRPSLTDVPSLHRSYPASSVLRTSPPPHTARPSSRELPVDPNLRSPLGLPVLRLVPCVCMLSPLPRQVRETKSLVTNLSTSAFPKFRVGRLLHYGFRGLLSVHSRYGLQTRQVALCDPLHRRLRRFCCLHRRSNCYRVERSSSRAGLSPAVVQRLFTAHRKIPMSLKIPPKPGRSEETAQTCAKT